MSAARLPHTGEDGRAQMVDVGAKQPSERHAVAEALVRMSAATIAMVEAGELAKGEVFGTARLAGIQAAKRTAELIPLAHPLPLTHVELTLDSSPDDGLVTIRAAARTVARTGVEMEAMTAASVAALTVYDMVKGVERGVTIERVALLEKSGGKSDWAREVSGS